MSMPGRDRALSAVGMSPDETSSVAVSAASTAVPATTDSAIETNIFQPSIMAALHQAQLDCSAQNWPQVIAACESAIAQCQVCLQPMQKDDAMVDKEKTIAALQQALTYQPQQVALQLQLADLYAEQQQWTQAIHHYQQALTLAPRNASGNASRNASKNLQAQRGLENAWINLAQERRAAAGAASAVRVYLEGLRSQPQLFVAYNRLRYNLMRYEIADGDPVLPIISAICGEGGSGGVGLCLDEVRENRGGDGLLSALE